MTSLLPDALRDLWQRFNDEQARLIDEHRNVWKQALLLENPPGKLSA